jgi:hypothetical protein
MIASREMFANGFERLIGQLSHQEHGQASGSYDSGFARWARKDIERDLKFLGDDFKEILASELASTTSDDLLDVLDRRRFVGGIFVRGGLWGGGLEHRFGMDLMGPAIQESTKFQGGGALPDATTELAEFLGS